MAHQRCEDPDGRWPITVPTAWEGSSETNRPGTTDGLFFITPAGDPARWAQDPAVDALFVTIMPGVTPAQVIEMWREVRDEAEQRGLRRDRFVRAPRSPFRGRRR